VKSLSDPMSTTQHRPPGFGLPAAMIALGLAVIVGAVTIGYFVIMGSDAGQTFQAPGSITITAEQSGNRMIMHELAGTFEGRVHRSSDEQLNGLVLRVTRDRDGVEIPVRSDTSWTVETTNHRRKSVAAFTVEEAGDYIVEASGTRDPVILQVAHGNPAGFIFVVLAGCGANLLGLTLIGLGIWRVFVVLRIRRTVCQS
jgi:hypothetical protein